MSAEAMLRSLGAAGLIAALVAGCSASATPAPSATVSPAASAATPAPSVAPATAAPPTPSAPSTPVPTATAVPVTPAPSGSWVPAGTLPEASYGWSGLPLGDGGALAISGDGLTAARWDAASGAWKKVAPLNADRQDYAAIGLRDGRVLVAGGVDTHDWEHWRSYSSAYVFDGATPEGAWTKVGLMGTARTAPVAALLPDGRVLVAGGAYIDGPPWGTGSAGVTLAVARPGTERPGRRLDDMAPPDLGRAMATAEIFDPATGTWSPTGSMTFARAGAVATTLSDGRVLVVGPTASITYGFMSEMDKRGLGTAEVYDPATGRFSLVGSIPPIDRAAVAADGVTLPQGDPFICTMGTLVPLPDGGALLVGQNDSWKNEGAITRTFRFDGATGAWTQVGPAYASVVDWSGDAPAQSSTPGEDLEGAYSGPMPFGRVLIAGGSWIDPKSKEWQAVATARAWDSTTGASSPLTRMPDARRGGPTVTLGDGSLLLIGELDYGEATTAIRFVPGG